MASKSKSARHRAPEDSTMSQQRRTSKQNERIRQARQVLSGDAVRPSPDPWAMAEGTIPLTSLQRNYVIVLVALLVIGTVLAVLFDSIALATIPFFILAIGLIAARFVF
jgi:hypothetical protein